MGTAFSGKLLVVVHTDRGDNIRIIPNSKVVNISLRGIIRQQARELVK
jgi:hypothetical protein